MRAMAALKWMTSELIGRLCGAATNATWEHGGAALRRYGGTFVVPDDARAECAVLKSIAFRYVMQREAAVRAQTQQREQLSSLLHAVASSAPRSLEPWLRAAYDEAPDDAAKLRVVVDQVASLTDTSVAIWFRRHSV
jgi:dGTPase